MIGYKIFRLSKRRPHYVRLVHRGWFGSRDIVTRAWMRAEVRDGRDGSGSPTYQTGFHYFRTYEDALRYQHRFKGTTFIGQVEVQRVWDKPTNPKVGLALEMRVV